MKHPAKYYLVDIDGTLTNYRPGALDPDKTLWGNFLFPIFRDMMVEKGWNPEEAAQAILDLTVRNQYWDYTDFIADFDLCTEEAYRRMRQWHKENLVPIEKNVALVRELYEEGHKLFIMSNNPYVGCILKLQAAGLADDDFGSPYFTRIFGTNLLHGCKGDISVWKHAFAQIPAPLSEIGTVGDNPVEDGEIPRSLGVGDTIILPREEIVRGIDR